MESEQNAIQRKGKCTKFLAKFFKGNSPGPDLKKQNPSAKKKCSRSEKILKYDDFGTPISFNYSDGSDQYRTPCGAGMSICVLFLSIGFLANNIYAMYTHKGNNVSNSTRYSFFKFSEKFTVKDDLRFAVGFYEDEKIFEYVDLVAGIYRSDWIIRNEENVDELELHPCSDEELDGFYPIRESQKQEYNSRKR